MSDSLAAIGEVAALARVIPRLPVARAASLGPGDDAAVLETGGRVVLTVDQMIDGPDFRRAWSSPFELGWKAAATNLADVAAMGAVPTGLLVALAAPGSTPVAELEGVADGIAAACGALAPDCGVLGGDLTMSRVLSIAVTATGSLAGAPVLRSGARAGDLVAYAGELGRASTALRLLFAAGEDDPGRIQALRDRDPALLAAQLAPVPPISAGSAAAAAGASAMLDVSDGLLLDAGRIAAASGVTIDLDRLALAPDVAAAQAALGDAAAAFASVLSGGEDHGLLACFPPRAVLPAAFRPIGRVREGPAVVLLAGRRPPRAAGPAGWDSFAGQEDVR